MTWTRLVRSELRKLTTTKLPLGFLIVLIVISATTGVAVVVGHDMDGSKGFIATAADQQSLIAFAANAMMLAGLFGAIAVAREYAHSTIVPTFLISPRRYPAVLAQVAAVAVGGALIGLVGTALTATAVAITTPMVGYHFMVTAVDLVQVLCAAAFTGAAGAVLGAGVGGVVRNTGGAVTGTVVVLFIIPPIAVQLASEAADWVPTALANALSGVAPSQGTLATLVALSMWAIVPAAAGLATALRRDVV